LKSRQKNQRDALAFLIYLAGRGRPRPKAGAEWTQE
jgi:hypothetical protein